MNIIATYRKNIFAIVEIPWLFIMWALLAIGFLFHLQGSADLFVNSGVVAALMFVLWWQIHKRTNVIKVAVPKPKREDKHPAYRRKKDEGT